MKDLSLFVESPLKPNDNKLINSNSNNNKDRENNNNSKDDEFDFL